MSFIFIKKNAFENVVWKMVAILSRPQCVKTQQKGHHFGTIYLQMLSNHPLEPVLTWFSYLDVRCTSRVNPENYMNYGDSSMKCFWKYNSFEDLLIFLHSPLLVVSVTYVLAWHVLLAAVIFSPQNLPQRLPGWSAGGSGSCGWHSPWMWPRM